MSIKIPIDLSALTAREKNPVGRRRARIGRVYLYPKDTELGPGGEIEGRTDKNGEQAYGWLRVGFTLTEHAQNYDVDSKGRPVSLAGKVVWQNYFLNRYSRIQELLNAAGVPLPEEGSGGLDGELLLNKEVDIQITERARTDDPTVKEPQVARVSMALDR